MRNSGIKARQKILEEGADIGENLKEARKVTAGVLVLNDPALVVYIQDKKQVEEEAGKEKSTTDRNRLQDFISKVAQQEQKEEDVRMMRSRNGRQQNCRPTLNTRNFLKMAQ